MIRLDGSLISGGFDAEGLHSESDLLAGGVTFASGASLNSAKIDGRIDMTGATFDGALDAGLLQADFLLMQSEDQNKAGFKDVILSGAKITGQVSMTGATFDGKLDAGFLQAGGDVFMCSEGQNKAGFKDVILRGAKITGQVDMTGATFDGTLDAGLLAGFCSCDPKAKTKPASRT